MRSCHMLSHVDMLLVFCSGPWLHRGAHGPGAVHGDAPLWAPPALAGRPQLLQQPHGAAPGGGGVHQRSTGGRSAWQARSYCFVWGLGCA